MCKIELPRYEANVLSATIAKPSVNSRYSITNVLCESLDSDKCVLVATNGRSMAAIYTNGIDPGQYELVKNKLYPVSEPGEFPNYQDILPKLSDDSDYQYEGKFYDEAKKLIAICTRKQIGIDYFLHFQLIKALEKSGNSFDVYIASTERPVYLKSEKLDLDVAIMPFNLQI